MFEIENFSCSYFDITFDVVMENGDRDTVQISNNAMTDINYVFGGRLPKYSIDALEYMCDAFAGYVQTMYNTYMQNVPYNSQSTEGYNEY